MYSIQFPEMVNSARTLLVKDYDATLSNLKLLLLSTKYTLFGDPYYGNNLEFLLHAPNDLVLKDIVIDDIYTCILNFMPQIKIERKDIKINISKDSVSVMLKCINLLDFTTNMYEINLLQEETR